MYKKIDILHKEEVSTFIPFSVCLYKTVEKYKIEVESSLLSLETVVYKPQIH